MWRGHLSDCCDWACDTEHVTISISLKQFAVRVCKHLHVSYGDCLIRDTGSHVDRHWRSWQLVWSHQLERLDVCGMSWSLYCPRLCVCLSLRLSCCFACEKVTKDFCGNCEIHHNCFAVRAFSKRKNPVLEKRSCSSSSPLHSCWNWSGFLQPHCPHKKKSHRRFPFIQVAA